MLCLVFAALIVVLDQFFKRWIELTVEVHGQMDLIPGFIELNHEQNRGAAFSILENQRWLLAGIAFIAAIVLVFILMRYTEGFWGTLGLSAILGGTVGNLIDRVFNGYVVDMFNFQFMKFAIFNIADIFLTLGFATFCIHFIISSIKASRHEKFLAEAEEGKAYDEEYREDDDVRYIESDDTDKDNATDRYVATDRHNATDRYVTTDRHIVTESYDSADHHNATDEYDIPDRYDIPDYDDLSDTKVIPTRNNKSYPTTQPEYSGRVSEPSRQYNRATEQPRHYDSITEEDYYYQSESEQFDDLTSTLESLETELGIVDEYDTDTLLREYGFEDTSH